MFEKTLSFFTTGVIGFSVCLVMKIGMSLSIFVGLLSGTLAILLFKYLQGDFSKKTDALDTSSEYKFKFQQYPFGDWSPFSVKAANQDKANAKAREIFLGLVTEKVTIMRVFYRVL